MLFETLSFDKQDGIAILTLNRPENYNAMTFKMGEEISEFVDFLKNDQNVKALIIRGQGPSFCSGGDLKSSFHMYDAPPAKVQQNALNFYKRFLCIRDLDIPTIAVIHGHTIGAGLCLAMACDMRIASTDTKLSMSFIKVGLNPGMGGTYFLPRLIGTAKALEMCLLGEAIDAQQALQIGLVNHVIAPEKLMEFSLNFASRITNNPTVAAHLIKKAIYQGLNGDLDAALTFEALSQATCSSTGDIAKAITAFNEKKPPKTE